MLAYRLLTFLDKRSLISRIFLLAFALALMSVASFRLSGFTEGPILCVFRLATGQPCPFCGTTRSLGSLLQGDFSSALSFNPFGYAVVVMFVLLLLSPRFVVALNKLLAEAWWKMGSRAQVLLVLSLLALVWILNLARIT